jgi:hypothetical protein
MTTSTIWISYDLGVRGDYPSLYAWLDDRSARECGDSLAVLNYTYTGDIKMSLKRDLEKSITSDRRTRIYVIYREKSSNRNKGAFIFGGRRSPPWTGFAVKGDDTVDEET